MHGHSGSADGVALGLESAGGVDRQAPADFGLSCFDEGMTLTWGSESESLVFEEFGDREAVVGLEEIQLVDADASGFQRLLHGGTGTGHLQRVPLGQWHDVVGIAHP